MKFLLKLLILLIIHIKPISSATTSTTAKFAVIMDFDTENILYDKDANSRIYPASMSKLMLIYMVFERIQNRTLSMEQEFLVSKKAWKFGGSKMFVNIGDKVSITDLIKV